MAAMQPEIPAAQTANRQIARAAGTVMLAFIASNVVGLLAKTLTARAFGTGFESSAFFAANRFSEILFNLVAGGALGSAFIPVFTGLLATDKRRRAWELASAIANLVTAILVLLSLLTLVFSRQVVQYILAPGFPEAQVILAAQLLRVQILSSMIFGLSGLAMGILNAHQHFLLPALAPALYQLGWIFGILVLSPAMGIFGLAWGVVIGSALHLLVQIPRLMRLPERRFTLSFGLHLPEVRDVARLMGPRLLGVAVVQLNFLLNTFLASYQSEGAITAISLAFPLMLMPEAAIAQSIAIAALPTFSAQVAKNRLNEMRTSLSAAIRMVLLLSIPAEIGLLLLRKPVVRMLYQGQSFSAQSSELVAWALLWYALGLVGHSVLEIISRAFYALHDTRTPVLVGIGAMTLNLALSVLFVEVFKWVGWMPHGGLALANSTATVLESILLLTLMARRLKGLEKGRILLALLKTLLAGGGMALALAWLQPALDSLPVGLLVAILVPAGILVYILLLLGMQSDELKSILRMLRSRHPLEDALE